ncbi:MAG: YdcF family protein, partial [Paracoccaceae bacterium]
QTNKAAERVAAGFALARAQPQARVVFTGGRGLRAGATQGPYPPLQQFLYDQGVASDRITLEYQSRNTAENARLSHALLSPNTDETWILVTSAFHMTRALNSFDAAGWPKMIPYPVDYRSGTPTRRGAGWTIDTVNTALKEYVGRIAYRWSGR